MGATGDCYEVAALLVAFGEEAVPEGSVIVHATCTGQGPIEGVEFGHAWIEHSFVEPITGVEIVTVIDRSNGKDMKMPAAFYYKVGDVREVYRYTREEARAWMQKTNHYGPWEGRYAGT